MEQQELSVRLLRRNVAHNGFDSRVKVLHGDFRELLNAESFHRTFDLVLSNPPYMPQATGPSYMPHVTGANICYYTIWACHMSQQAQDSSNQARKPWGRLQTESPGRATLNFLYHIPTKL